MINLDGDNSKYLSQEGFNRLKNELEKLRSEKREEIANRLEYAKSLGDLSENAEYQEAKEAQLANETRIIQIEEILGQAVLVSEEGPKTGSVDFGSTVIIKKEDGSDEKYTIVGSEEADPLNRKISYDSPLGKALLHAKAGDDVVVQTPKGEMRCKIVDIL